MGEGKTGLTQTGIKGPLSGGEASDNFHEVGGGGKTKTDSD